MQILTAESDFGSTIWLNGRDVSDLCTACKVPNKPGRIGFGWADVLLPTNSSRWWRELQVDSNGEPIVRRNWGLVSWQPTGSD